MNLAKLVESHYNAFRFALGLKDERGALIPEWHLVMEFAQMVWQDAVLRGIKRIQESGGKEVKAVDLAKSMYESWRAGWRRVAPNTPPWEELSRQSQLAWEASLRHLVNIVDLDEDDLRDLGDLEAHERRWQPWVAGKLHANDAGGNGPPAN